MTPPVSYTANPAPAPASGSQPASAPATGSGNPVAPFRLQFSGGYTSLALGGSAPSYSGGIFQTQVGQSFNIDSRNSLFLNGVFRLGALSDGSGHDISLVHFGIEGGYEGWIVPSVLSAFVYGGLGTNVLYSQQAGVAPSVTRALDNQSMFALTLGGGFSLARGVLVFSGGFQPNFGLSVPETPDSFGGRGYNPIGYFFMGGLDLARIVDWAGGRFPRDISLGQFVRGITPGIILDTTYTYNLGNPSTGQNALRIFDTHADRPMFNFVELTLDRPVDADNPFGFRFDFGVGENARVSRAHSSFSGDWYDLREIYARLRLPVGNGITLRGGKFTTLIGPESISSPNNNHISTSWQYGLGEPFTHLGVLVDYPFIVDGATTRLAATTGIINGWDNVLDRSAGIGWIGSLAANPTDWLSITGSGTLGSESGRLRSIADLIVAVKVNDATSTAGGFDRFTASASYDWGHEGAGPGGQAEDNWHTLSLTARLGLIPQVSFAQGFEVFFDPDGARTSTPQTMWSTRSTLRVAPFAASDITALRGIQARAEFRHDSSSAPSFLAGALPTNSQNTFGFQLAYVY